MPLYEMMITFTSDDQERKHGFVLSYVERKYNATEEQTSMTTTYPATDVPIDTSTGITTTGVASSSYTVLILMHCHNLSYLGVY
jgi:hypothetical protein